MELLELKRRFGKTVKEYKDGHLMVVHESLVHEFIDEIIKEHKADLATAQVQVAVMAEALQEETDD